MKKLLLVLLLLLVPCAALAGELTLSAEVGEVDYTFHADDSFVVLKYTTPAESGWMTLYDAAGDFSGVVRLPLSGAGGRVKVTVENLRQRTLFSGTVSLPADPAWSVPTGSGRAKVKNLALIETPEGLHYTFNAEGADYLMLSYKSKQESGSLYVFPANGEGLFEGDIPLPLTFARSYVTVKVLSGTANATYAEARAQKGWAAPEAPEVTGEGRLKGVTVCVDAGHQENGEFVREPIGPGLQGASSGSGGMAQGKVTMRLEHIVTLEIAYRLRDELLRQGAEVVMTRTEVAPFISNLERCAIAAEGGADFMLRLHGNYRSGNTDKYGIGIYMPRNSDYAKAIATPEEWETMGQMLLDAMRNAVGYEANSRTGGISRTDDYIGNNWATMPCFLVEMGYMSNPREDVLLSAPAYQQWLAEGMAQGVYEMAVYRGLIEEEKE